MQTVKQRSYTRYEIKLVATLVVNNTNFIQCMIRDFCSGGLFLQPLTHDGIESLKPLQTKRIIFSVNLKQGGDDFSLDAKIMHVRKYGFGVEFKNQSEVAFDALKKEAQDTFGLKPSDRRNNTVILSNQKKLENDLSSLLNKVLPAIISSFYRHIKTLSLETNETFQQLENKATLQDIINKLEKNKKPLLKNFCSTIQDTSHLFLVNSEQDTESNTESSLSQLNNNDFEDWLNILTVIRNLESVYAKQLNQLQLKTAYILGVNKNKDLNPVNPGRLCDCFRNIINTFDANTLVKNMLYEIFEKTLVEFLPGLYIRMDSILIEHGAPLVIDSVTNWTKPVAEQSGSYFEQTTEINSSQPSVSELAIGTSNSSSLLNQLQEQNTSPYTDTTTTEIIPEFSTEEIRSALTNLHQQTAYTKIPHHTSAHLKFDLLQVLENRASSKKRLSKSDENSLDVYGCLFEILFNKLLSEQKIKSYLYHIYISFIDYGMLNSDFLETSNNPARNILNHLFWLELASTNDKLVKNTQTVKSLDQIVEEIAKYSLHHPSTFSLIEHKLREFINPIKQSIENKTLRVTKVYEGKQKLKKAQQSVEEEFNRRQLTNKKSPKIISTLLNAGWEHLLVLAKLNQDNNAFQSHLRIIINLNAWLTGSEKASKEQADTTLKFIDTQLQSVCTNTFFHDKIIGDLKILLLGSGILPDSDAMKMVVLPKNTAALSTRKRNNHHKQLGRLKVGEWLTFLLKKQPEPLKLAWVSETQNTFVFVDRSGIKKLELDHDELIALVDKGVAQKIESLDIPLMDRAIDIMLLEMHKKRVCKATHDPITQLLNRNIFIKQLKRELTGLDNAIHLLCNIEIQDFNIITDECGLAAGDALIKQLADSLKIYLRGEEIITQLDNKTFSILLKNCPTEAANKVAKKLQSRLISNPFIWLNKKYIIAVNIGVVPFSSNTDYDINSLLQKTSSITLSAANAGRNSILIHKEDEETVKTPGTWNNKISKLFTKYSFFLQCQKIAAINPEKNSHSHYKILLGIKNKKKNNIIDPDEFFSNVENNRSLSEIDRWVILTIFSWIEQHQSIFESLAGFSISLSSESINSKDFLDFLHQTLSSSNIILNKITFEIPETVATDNFLVAQQFLKKIKLLNCKVALSDFGENFYSSHSFLKSLDIDYLIISKLLIKSIHNNTFDIDIVKSLISIAHSLGLETIAESVENDKIHAILREIGIDYCLGSYIQKPVLLTNISSAPLPGS